MNDEVVLFETLGGVARVSLSRPEALALLRAAHDETDVTLAELSLAAGARLMQTQDAVEGPAAFFAKRAPRWTGQ